MKTVFCSLLILPLLIGCIFGNNDGGKGNGETTTGPGAIDGFVSMVDARGFTKSSLIFQNDILAKFGKKTSNIRRSLYSSMRAFEATPEREMKCSSGSTRQESGAVAAAHSLISVGTLSIGLKNEALLEVPFVQKSGEYYGALGKGKAWKKGVYSVVAKGSGDALAFEGTLSMPDVLEDAAVNGNLLENGPVTLAANSPVELSWKIQTDPDEMDYMLFQVFGDKDGSKVNVLCGIKESEITTKWVIPAVQLKEFTSELENGQIFLYRGNLARAEDPKIGRVDTEGLRLSVSTVSFAN